MAAYLAQDQAGLGFHISVVGNHEDQQDSSGRQRMADSLPS
jgi:hypothetical protein